MIIKKYQAKTEAEATEQAKKELGPNVVVMNVKQIKRKGLFSFLKAKQVEITVALEEEQESAAKKVQAKPQSTYINTGISENSVILPEGMNNLQTSVIIEKDRKEEPKESALEEKLDSLQSFLEKQLQQKEEEKAEPEEKEEKKENNVFMQLLYNTMMENEVNEKYANQILDEIEKSNHVNMPMDHILANVYQKTILKFGKPIGIQPAKKGPKVVFFVGPTGVGKTTTIAKIASKFKVDEKKKIVLLTADTYRIAAAEQLRTYANILEVPFKVIYTVEEIEEAIAEFKDFDYIMVDTAGHSHHNESQRDNMEQFIHSVDKLAEKEVFLVVSATTKYKDLLSIANSYKDITEYKLIFTKLDETTTLGNLLNLKLYTGADLSYVTCGQNVPDDIETFNPQSTVKQLLGGKK